ncbi:MAG: hypothetical protein QM661_00940 [Solimonas sp.]
MNLPPSVSPSLPSPDAKAGALRVAFVQACWHREIVDRARDGSTASSGARKRKSRHGVGFSLGMAERAGFEPAIRL